MLRHQCLSRLYFARSYFARVATGSTLGRATPGRATLAALSALAFMACSSEPSDPPPADAAPADASVDAGLEIDAAPPPPPPPPLFSHERGFYSETFELVVTPETDDIEVYYTLDGRDPDGPSGQLYGAPIAINTTTVVRFAFKTGGVLMGETVTHSYVLPNDIPGQAAPAGYPADWWQSHASGPWEADYAMDPEVVLGSASAHMFPDTFYSIPAVSVVMDPNDLFGPAGIHENPLEEDASWVRMASFEVLRHELRPSAQGNCGVRIFGDLARDPARTPKLSFQVEFAPQYGPANLDYPLYDDNGVSVFSTLVLRAGYHRSWLHPSASQRRRAQYLREIFASDMQREMGHLSPRARLMHVFLNGLYWGLYVVQERPDAGFQAAHLGGTANEYDVLDSGEVVDGDRIAWDQMMTLVEAGVDTPGAYQSLAQQLDLENFVDYVLLQQYMGNSDWPEDNWYAARHRIGDGLFRFFNWDAEAGLGDEDDDTIALDEPDTPARIFQRLRENPEFLIYFADRINKHVASGGPLTQSRTLERMHELWDIAGPAVFGESARWGDHWRDLRGEPDAELYSYDRHWFEELDRLERDYLTLRSTIVIQQYRDAGIYPPVDAPLLFRHGGPVPAGFQLSMLGDGPDRNVFYTIDGSDPRLAGGAVAGSATIYGGPIAINTAITIKTRARLSSGEWSALTEAEFTIE